MGCWRRRRSFTMMMNDDDTNDGGTNDGDSDDGTNVFC